jgi:hypothetical protein
LPVDEIAAEKRRQEVAQIRDYYAQLHRLDTVAFRIRTANAAACKDRVSAQIGLYAATPRSLPQRFRSFSADALDLRWMRATVISVVEGSPAAQAGLMRGDDLITFNDQPVPVTGTMGWMGGFLRHNGERPVTIKLRRGDAVDTTLTVTPVTGCAIPIALDSSQEPNAFTDFNKIVIHAGILRVARTDADLAVVIGHELAHVTMGHYGKKMQNALVAAAGGALIDGGFMLGTVDTRGAFTRQMFGAGARAFSVGFEREADYVGAYYAARAGYDVAGAAAVWRALSLETPSAIRVGATHPTTPERFVQMQHVAAEIADKERRHLPLVPDIRMSAAGAEPADADPR